MLRKGAPPHKEIGFIFLLVCQLNGQTLHFKVFSQTFEDDMGPFKAPGHTTPPMCVAYRKWPHCYLLLNLQTLSDFAAYSG